VSNLAWPAGHDEEAASILREHAGIGVEIAPTKVWPQPLAASPAEVRAYREFWERQGLPIVALQALLFGRPDLTIFGEPASRQATLEYLKGIVRLAGDLGATALVFGSPKNRQVGDLPPKRIASIAIPFFRELGDFAARCGTCLCIEPNPPQYGCDWITTSQQACDLVERVDSPGFGLHLDTGGALLVEEDLEDVVPQLVERIRHFHISEPSLRSLTNQNVPHERIASALQTAGYAGWISIEMSQQAFERPWNLELAQSLELVERNYLPMGCPAH
jgi:sugar phosphate isomerase/epimerase